MAEVASCSERSICHIQSNLHRFNSTRAPENGGRRPQLITLTVLKALQGHLLKEPELYHEEMAGFLADKFRVVVSTHSLKRALKAIR